MGEDGGGDGEGEAEVERGSPTVLIKVRI